MDPHFPSDPTPNELVQLIHAYLTGDAPWEAVTALAARTTFTHRDRPVFGRDDHTDPQAWEDTVGLIFKLPTAKERELKALAKFV